MVCLFGFGSLLHALPFFGNDIVDLEKWRLYRTVNDFNNNCIQHNLFSIFIFCFCTKGFPRLEVVFFWRSENGDEFIEREVRLEIRWAILHFVAFFNEHWALVRLCNGSWSITECRHSILNAWKTLANYCFIYMSGLTTMVTTKTTTTTKYVCQTANIKQSLIIFK